MKNLIYVMGFFALVSCNTEDTQVGPISYYADSELVWPDDEDDRIILNASMCAKSEPADYDVAVFSFPLGKNLDDAAAEVLTPEVAGGEDNDNLNSIIDPESTTRINKKYQSGGKSYSSYSPQNSFGVSVEMGAVVILGIINDSGDITHITGIETSSATVKDVCFTLVK